jgi:hypothetical protein
VIESSLAWKAAVKSVWSMEPVMTIGLSMEPAGRMEQPAAVVRATALSGMVVSSA